jgi:hypothetical protein
MTGGSSGGPWLSADLNLNTGVGGAVSSLNSYGYANTANTYGPKFDTNTASVWAAAKTGAASAPVNTIVG